MDKIALKAKLNTLENLSNEEKAYLLALIESKTYGLVWEEKPEDVEIRLQNELPIFREMKEREILSKNLPNTQLFDPTKQIPNHILIEGDNLHALTALSFTHQNAIDVIYIDPPYNTGNKDFRYNDKFIDKEDTFRHSAWLSFMQKRLKIAKELLNEKGVIFISIDDNEQAQLKLLCDEIFGENNFVSDIIWQSRKSVSNDTFISLNHNYTLFYAKNISLLDKNDVRLPISKEKFENPDNDSRGAWVADPFDAPNIRPNLTYVIKNPFNGKEFLPPKGRCWRTTEEEYLKLLEDKRIIFGKKGDSKPQLKRFLDFAEKKGTTPISIWYDIDTTTNGTQQLEQIFGNKVFTNPKPLGLLDRILKISSKPNSKILDFFAGSGTTMHAVMQLNAEDGGNRQCILVTNNENNICEEVTYIRNKKVIEGYTTPKGAAVAGLKENNLRYYVCDFVGREETVENKKRLTMEATHLLCIKENCYVEITQDYAAGDSMRIFAEQAACFLIIYSDDFIPDAIPIIEQLHTDLGLLVKVYVFSQGSYAYDSDFEEVADLIELCALPDAIYRAYQNVLPKKKMEQAGETKDGLF
ncbi:site-specific DNA-methyltransferase [Hugenholtzia roseola]|uniref:site-specific DNA-methyltransferase n=1 Tax=Hugenholtzia roseola TaxID=1002 RepID=UPI00055891F2|nr:site-specific DNA-methyltransferase [Hugenholtzia roseola]